MPSPSQLSPSRLAYLGDTVYELCVRERLVRLNARRPSIDALEFVTAMGHANIPKSATLAEYRAATGLECLFGWLRLMGRDDRILALFDAAFPEEDPANGAEKDPGREETE